jgi:hypothetical protein
MCQSNGSRPAALDAEQVATQALQLDTSDEVERLLEDHLPGNDTATKDLS